MQSKESARHERPAVDEAALAAARGADRLLEAARARGSERWIKFFEPIPDLLRDGRIKDLRGVAIKARSAYGPKDLVREGLPEEVTEPFMGQLDRLLKALARDAMES